MNFTSTSSSSQSPPSTAEKEHMFDKVVTPSDVGKLNRLVIPKQHAEKYFPLDSSANEKGLLLNFEDRNGKPWRFRYSYWNSSQSYVMTKGWSRFVKDKKLDAGDIVSFQRGLGECFKDRLYIDWRKRPEPSSTIAPLHFNQTHFAFHRSVPWSPLLMPPPVNNFGFRTRPVYYLKSPDEWTSVSEPFVQVNQNQLNPYRQYSGQNNCQNEEGKGNGKRLRLFGVNMECQVSDTTTTTDEEEDSSDQLEIDFMSKGKGLERDF